MKTVFVAVIFSGIALAAPAAETARLDYLGVNLSGAEFGSHPEPGPNNPGTLGHDYTFPTAAEVDAYAAAGFNVVRLPFAWERLQPKPNGPFDEKYLAGLDEVVRAAGAKGVAVIVEPANFGYGYGALIGSAATPNSVFADLWRRIALHYAHRPWVMFGLMNEPHDQSPADWLPSAQAAIDAIRATGAKQEILVPGTYYAQGTSWVSRGNAADFAEHITDPAHNSAFEIHQYNDADQSGRSPGPVSATIGADRLRDVTAWAEASHRRLFLAEFGANNDAPSITAMRNQLAFVQEHRAVWQGAAIWGGGPWWPDGYPLTVENRAGVFGPQIAAMKDFLPNKPSALSPVLHGRGRS
jgi:endoglucanase